jgi:hypothetical protein
VVKKKVELLDEPVVLKVFDGKPNDSGNVAGKTGRTSDASSVMDFPSALLGYGVIALAVPDFSAGWAE